MEFKERMPDCVIERQLEEMFANERKILAKQMSHLESANLGNVTIEQLEDVIKTIKNFKRYIDDCRLEYYNITKKRNQEAEKLIADYKYAISKAKHLINAKYES